MAIVSGTVRGRPRIRLELTESALGPCGFEGTLEGFLEPPALPVPLRRLHDRTAVVRMHRTTLHEEDLPFKPFIWLVLFPRSKGQDLTEDFSAAGKRSFPVVAYGYEGSAIEEPLTMERMYDLGLGTVELSE
ncbi:MAG TPA: hypothetical protein VIB49_02770 [Thermoplasmata archaeon]|jgi:hypothetical protein